MKFKKGDRVKITDVLESTDIILLNPEDYLDATGTITKVSENATYPYKVNFDNEGLNDSGNDC